MIGVSSHGSSTALREHQGQSHPGGPERGGNLPKVTQSVTGLNPTDLQSLDSRGNTWDYSENSIEFCTVTDPQMSQRIILIAIIIIITTTIIIIDVIIKSVYQQFPRLSPAPFQRPEPHFLC